MSESFFDAIKPHVVVTRTDDNTPGREFFAMPPRWEPAGGPIFDAIELAPVVEYDDGICEVYESLADIPAQELSKVFWSIYGHTTGEGALCIGDFTTRDHALEVIRRLLGDLRPFKGKD